MSTGITRVSPSEVKDMISGNGIALIDVRPHEMYEEGHIEGAINLPYDSINEATAPQTIGALDTPFIVYCTKGHLSQLAAEELEDLGYTKIYEMSGGIRVWPYGLVK